MVDLNTLRNCRMVGAGAIAYIDTTLLLELCDLAERALVADEPKPTSTHSAVTLDRLEQMRKEVTDGSMILGDSEEELHAVIDLAKKWLSLKEELDAANLIAFDLRTQLIEANQTIDLLKQQRVEAANVQLRQAGTIEHWRNHSLYLENRIASLSKEVRTLSDQLEVAQKKSANSAAEYWQGEYNRINALLEAEYEKSSKAEAAVDHMLAIVKIINAKIDKQ